MLNSKLISCIFIFLFFSLTPVISESSDSTGDEERSPERMIEVLLENAENQTGTARRNSYIEAAELKQLTGDLDGAAELFEMASLAVKGEKHFQSLYRSAVLQTEMANYKSAEASIRAIRTFSDNLPLRIKSTILYSRIKSLYGDKNEAYRLILDLFKSGSQLPFEAFIWARDFYDLYSSTMNLNELKTIINNEGLFKKAGYTSGSYIPNPETVFGIKATGILKATGISAKETPDTPEDPETDTVDIQLGSFLRMENAEDLIKTLTASGYKAVIKIKNVNGKEYNIVIIPKIAQEKVQQFIVELKSRGFEGYPLY